jgi:hypothetical protein
VNAALGGEGDAKRAAEEGFNSLKVSKIWSAGSSALGNNEHTTSGRLR